MSTLRPLLWYDTTVTVKTYVPVGGGRELPGTVVVALSFVGDHAGERHDVSLPHAIVGCHTGRECYWYVLH